MKVNEEITVKSGDDFFENNDHCKCPNHENPKNSELQHFEPEEITDDFEAESVCSDIFAVSENGLNK